MSRFAPFAFVLAGLVAIAGCSTDPNGPGGTVPTGTGGGSATCIQAGNQIDCKAKIEVIRDGTSPITSNASVPIQVGTIAQGGSSDTIFTINNTANMLAAADLIIEGVQLDYDVASPEEDKDTGNVAFQCYADDGTTKCSDIPAASWMKIVPGGLENPAQKRTSAVNLRIRYTRFDSINRTAKLHIKVRNAQVAEFVVNFTTVQGQPKANIQPGKLEWPLVQAGKTEPRSLTISNVGNATLSISKFDFAGDVFSLVVDGDPDAIVHKGGAMVKFEPTLDIEAGGQKKITVTFAPKDDKPKQGTITVWSNDKSAASIAVPLQANSAVPCLELLPAIKLPFGGVLAGAFSTKDLIAKNCGTADLEIYSIEFVEGTTSDEFSFDYTKTIKEGGKLDAKNSNLDPLGPSKVKYLIIPKNASVPVTVKYSPSDITPEDPVTKAPKPDVGVIKFTSNAFNAKTVIVEGIGVNQTCPQAKVSVKEGEEVVPQTPLHLKGDGSVAPNGTIKKYKWTVKQPPGSNKPLSPNFSFPNPTLTADAAGEYEFCLEVWDGNDVKSCDPACVKVNVVPNNAIHVELLWDTPGDPDQNDTGPMAGADMDLHFAHALASGPDIDCDGNGDPWFSNPFDCFWFNSNPGWGSADAGAGDDPSLDLDDTDGAGPENLNLASPEGNAKDPNAYSVGVHYWNDHGFGPSYATVTVFLQGVVTLKVDKIKMDPLDMWYVGKINWPNQLTSGPLPPISMCYQSGDACLGLSDPNNPKAGKMWKPVGDWCITKCYVNELFIAAAGGAAQIGSCKKK